ncbi:MAG: DNA-directed RNA polymerase subunit alpha [Candidatus Paceibacterota bacterium]
MLDHTIVLPSKPRVVKEEGLVGVYEIDSLYPGYGHTLGNSLRRIILSSLEGTAITSVKIDGVNHEFSTIPGVKEDVIILLLNLKKVNFKLLTDEPQTVTLKAEGPAKVTARDIKAGGQIEVLNTDQYLVEITDKNITLDIEMVVEKSFGYVPKEALQKDKVGIGTIALDAVFTPIRRVNYEVENMRVGDRTDYNKLRFSIETDGTITPREALENAITIMIQQLQAVVGFQEGRSLVEEAESVQQEIPNEEEKDSEEEKEFLKTRVETLGFSTRTANALDKANIRTVGGLIKKGEDDLLALDGLGEKGVQEIKRSLGNFGLTLK